MVFDTLIPPLAAHHAHHNHVSAWWETGLAVALSLVFVAFAVEALAAKRKGGGAMRDSGWVVDVAGMTCGGCSSRLQRVLLAVDGIESAEVDLGGALATVAGVVSSDALVGAIQEAGFDPGQPQRAA
jgi:copper chaperone CopZ